MAVFGKPMCQARSGRWTKAPTLSPGSIPHNGHSCVLFIFYTVWKCVSSHIKKPGGRKECTLGLWFHISGIFFFFFSFLFLMCWLHPQVCSMMLQAIMSRHDSPEGERWPFSCDSSSEGRKPFPKVPRQYYPPVPRLYLGHMTLPDTTMAKRIGITNTWLRTILIPGEARVQLPQGMRSGGYLTRTETLLGRKKCNSCRQPATP